MLRKIVIALVLAPGCTAEPARSPADQGGLPLIVPAATAVPEAWPPEATTPLAADACRALRLALSPARNGVLAPEALERAFAGAAPALRDAVCACPPRRSEGLLLVTTTPDRGQIAARSYEPDTVIDTCLAERLRGAALPRWHLGSDCIACGPKRYGVLRGSPPVDREPADGVATVTFLVGVAR